MPHRSLAHHPAACSSACLPAHALASTCSLHAYSVLLQSMLKMTSPGCPSSSSDDMHASH